MPNVRYTVNEFIIIIFLLRHISIIIIIVSYCNAGFTNKFDDFNCLMKQQTKSENGTGKVLNIACTCASYKLCLHFNCMHCALTEF